MPTTRHRDYTDATAPLLTYTFNSDGSVHSVNVMFTPTEQDAIASSILEREFDHIHSETILPHHPLNDVINRLKGL